VVKLLFEKGADIEAETNCGRTALHWAALRGHDAVVKLLLEKGADVEPKDSNGRTALDIASSYGHEAVVNVLSNVKNISRKRPSKTAKRTGRTGLGSPFSPSNIGRPSVLKLLNGLDGRHLKPY
jgi:ankyrin repeat protein